MEIADTIQIEKKQLLPAGSIPVRVEVKSFLADTCTPVGLYLRLRDQFPGAVLLESADNAEGKNSRSFIAIQPVAEIVVGREAVIKVPSCGIDMRVLSGTADIPGMLNDFLSLFSLPGDVPEEAVTGLIGYTGYDAVKFFETAARGNETEENSTPLIRYALYRTIIVFDHFRHRMHIVGQLLPGDRDDTVQVELLVRQSNVPQFPFTVNGREMPNMEDEEFLSMAAKGIAHCRRGDVFQVVLSRRFRQGFSGDEFNVYRALRAINPSPYLFFADFGDYRIFGSSPEAQLVVRDGRATVHPIAGTFRRTGNDDMDNKLEKELIADPKENAEHIMLVDLARNDLSRSASDVRVDSLREVHRYSHVIHLVSKVSGKLKPGANLFRLLGDTFPAGTLSGAPKIRAMELIAHYEKDPRGFYGGCIGLVGFDGTMNQAIMIRSFLSRNGELAYQAGAGIVVSSQPEMELAEIGNKLGALRKAIVMATQISN